LKNKIALLTKNKTIVCAKLFLKNTEINKKLSQPSLKTKVIGGIKTLCAKSWRIYGLKVNSVATYVGNVPSRVARLFLVQYTKGGQNIPNDYKITKCP
jgi:hypothetical protein